MALRKHGVGEIVPDEDQQGAQRTAASQQHDSQKPWGNYDEQALQQENEDG